MKIKKVVIALDSFKGSLSSLDAGLAFAQGIRTADPSITTLVYAVADGGEGTIESFQHNCKGQICSVNILDPLGLPINAVYAALKEGTAVIEMAKASGLTLVPPHLRNPLNTSTYGTGQLIAHALDNGAHHIILAIGGSATNDAGMGMLSALGIKFYDKQGKILDGVGKNLSRIFKIDTSSIHPQLQNCRFDAACDVDNPLYGERGAAYIYGPQKGASPDIVAQLDKGLRHFAQIVQNQFDKDIAHFPGSGAAGGMGAGLYAFTNTTLRSGIEIILDQIGIDKELQDASIVIVGEGRLDKQTSMGKAPMGIAKRAQKFNVPAIAVGGALDGDPTLLHECGISAYFSALAQAMSVEEAMEETTAKAALIRQARELILFAKIFQGD